MEYRRLGRTDLAVSAVCLGTMTWGQQNTEAEAHAQMDFALERGVNFLDAAEMYPIPPAAETQGRTEEYIGSWMAARGNRDRIVLATKVSGPSGRFGYLRDGDPRLDAKNVRTALEDSLRRLRTECVDLYQLHWPDRRTNYFGQLGYRHDPDAPMTPPEETLTVLDELVRAGKIRHVGLSNETPWGAMRFLALAERNGWPRMASIQNPYNLLNRIFEIGLAECAHREDCGLLAYSPLAGGTLTGKYLGGAKPPGARMTLFSGYDRYFKPRGIAATERYVDLARRHGLDPAQMALAFVHTRPFVTSTIIGATSLDQLEADMAAFDLALPDEVLADIEAVHQDNPNPCP
jgi:aryl-alcohol dehydrogenase-like predicted oxidoreductase